MNTIYTIKDFLTSGYTIQWYILITLILLLTMTIKGALYMVKNRPISLQYSLKFSVLSFFLFAFITWLILPTPVLTHPKLPLFDPVDISQESPLLVRFDRPINPSVLFEINPPVAGAWKITHSWPGLIPSNAAIFTPSSPVTPGTEYSVAIDSFSPLQPDERILFVFKTSESEVKTPGEAPDAEKHAEVSVNLEANTNEDGQKTETIDTDNTEAETEFRLQVPLIHQQYTFGCFSAAARMTLAYYGVTGIGEVEFIDMVGKDNTERNFVSNIWGNPNAAVVGTIDGSGPGGYGTHWDPVARVLNQYRPTEVKRHTTVPEILSEVSKGYPVMVWWVNGVWPARDVSWNLPDGSKVYTVNGMHVEVVTGWKGPMDNPTTIYTNDPWRGYRAYTRGQFDQLWKWFDNTAVIVR
ncbi:MAG: C39 family peptidase [Candidatus Roizmanbacteria bacterium]|nr:C39 family peptidase [Candidatus Roizmanbacteria bacterium]